MQGLDSFSPEIIWKCDDGQTVIFSGMKRASSSLLFAGGFSSASGHRHLVQGHGNHELLRQGHFRAHRWGGITPGALQQALDYHIQGDADHCALAATWGADQAHRVQGH